MIKSKEDLKHLKAIVFNAMVKALWICPGDVLLASKHKFNSNSMYPALGVGDVAEKITMAFLKKIDKKPVSINFLNTYLATAEGIVSHQSNNLKKSVDTVLKKYPPEAYTGELMDIPENIQEEIYSHLMEVCYVSAEYVLKGAKGE